MLNKPVYLLLLIFCSSAVSYKILIVCGPPSRSHFNLCSAVANTLADRKHEITFITAYTVPNPKYREIQVNMDKMLENLPSPFDMNAMSTSRTLTMMGELTKFVSKAVFSSPNVIKFLNDKSEKFDLVIVEYFINHHMLGLSVKYGCPAILLAPIGLNMMPWLTEATGNSASLATIPSAMSTFPYNMNLWQRTANTLFHLIGEGISCFLHRPMIKELYVENFPEESKTLPFDELKTKVASVISNTHYSLGGVRPLLPNIVEVGGYHIEEPAPLPPNLQKIMDEAKNGVIFFSLGSVIKTKEMTPVFRQIIVKTLSKFKETVLWKFDDELPNLPKNIITQKWLPQTSILAHPNIKLFITHGGLLSCTEATHFGVPILILPIFGDQKYNGKIFSDRGQGKFLHFFDVTEESLESSVREMLTNPRYAETSKKVSKLYHDRPMKPRDLLAYQVEHVIKTGGAPHLTPPQLPRYSLLLLDVIAVILFPIIGIVLLLGYCCKRILKRFGMCCKKSADPKKMKSKMN